MAWAKAAPLPLAEAAAWASARGACGGSGGGGRGQGSARDRQSRGRGGYAGGWRCACRARGMMVVSRTAACGKAGTLWQWRMAKGRGGAGQDPRTCSACPATRPCPLTRESLGNGAAAAGSDGLGKRLGDSVGGRGAALWGSGSSRERGCKAGRAGRRGGAQRRPQIGRTAEPGRLVEQAETHNAGGDVGQFRSRPAGAAWLSHVRHTRRSTPPPARNTTLLPQNPQAHIPIARLPGRQPTRAPGPGRSRSPARWPVRWPEPACWPWTRGLRGGGGGRAQGVMG